VKIDISILKIEISIMNFLISISKKKKNLKIIIWILEILLFKSRNLYLSSENSYSNLKITPYFKFFESNKNFQNGNIKFQIK
jgi:hypothetical protein